MQNASEFWICQGPEYTRILNTSGFGIYQNPECAFGSEHARALNMSGLQRVLNMSEYTWLSDWICLDLSEYATICANMPKSAWMTIALYFPIVIPCLLESVVTYFNVYTKLEVLVSSGEGGVAYSKRCIETTRFHPNSRNKGY